MRPESRIANRACAAEAAATASRRRESRLRFSLAQLMGAVVFASLLAWAVFPRTAIDSQSRYQTQRAGGEIQDQILDDESREEYNRILAEKIAMLEREESRR